MTSRPLIERTLIDVVVADRALLQAEFDAIIAANFPVPAGRRERLPPRRAGAVAAAFATPAPDRPSPAGPTPAGDHGGGNVQARQRGPPPRRNGPLTGPPVRRQ